MRYLLVPYGKRDETKHKHIGGKRYANLDRGVILFLLLNYLHKDELIK